ncbi:MAG TPA: MFS transporter [Solirubrobacteraceae bacterium]|nr:MFS transporter [Solirubrobacteraceae bacterium]
MTPTRRRALVTIALGEFVDGYDLIVISGALLQLRPHFHLDTGQLAWLGAAAFFGSAVGALFFGDLTDRVGRRRVFVLNLIAFVGLALLSAAITQLWMLFVIRVLIGVAIGADIVASIAFLAELSPSGSRGSWAGALPQLTWSLGAICAILLAAALTSLTGPQAWRVMFAAGALPAVVVLTLRRSLPDSPRWLLARGRVAEAVAVFEQFGLKVVDRSQLVRSLQPRARVGDAGHRRSLTVWLQPYRKIFAPKVRGAALFAILMIGLIPLNGIGQSVLTSFVLKEYGNLSDVGALLGGSVLWIGAILGSLLAFKVIDGIGRITSVVSALVGFVVVYVLMATVAAGTVALVPLFCLLGVVTWFGASACWPLPSELLPTTIRGRAQGLGSGLQRVAIGVNVLISPHLLAAIGFSATVLLAAGISVALIPLAMWGRRYEPAGKSIELASGDRPLDLPYETTAPDGGLSSTVIPTATG